MKRLPVNHLNRKDFLRLSGMQLGALFLLNQGSSLSRLSPTIPLGLADQWPALKLNQLPDPIAEIFKRTPEAHLDRAGYLTLDGAGDANSGRVPQVYTQWNQKYHRRIDRLNTRVPWGIVLHWFGDTPDKNLNIKGYLNGFNGVRRYEDVSSGTSAHFLVGEQVPFSVTSDNLGILQTQAPDTDGTPFIAAHMRGLSQDAHDENKQYYLLACNRLTAEDPLFQSFLQDLYGSDYVHPNERTIAIEIAGSDFDNQLPSPQKTANTLAVVWALMQRYQIPPTHLLGHHEVQINKGDPGKQFMAMMRYLVGIKALLQDNSLMKLLTFGPFIGPDHDTIKAVERYFSYVRGYHALVSLPSQVYDWEATSRFWFVYPLVGGGINTPKLAGTFDPPISGDFTRSGSGYLLPGNHEGVDIHHPTPPGATRPAEDALIQLIANGECMYTGNIGDCHNGRTLIFRHLQPDGSLILSVYSHLSEIEKLKVGGIYDRGHYLGLVNAQSDGCGRFLHFAVAYGATWELDLRAKPFAPLGVGPSWIRDRYFEPLAYLSQYGVHAV